MKVVVIGTWDEKEANALRDECNELGKLLAFNNHTLIASPSSGVQGLVAKSYKEFGGKMFIGFYPNVKLMKEVGEIALVKPDKEIFTNEDYSIRNILQIKAGEAVIALSGRTGTLGELLTAISDYKLPIAYLNNSSELIDKYINIDSNFKNKIFIAKDVKALIEFVNKLD